MDRSALVLTTKRFVKELSDAEKGIKTSLPFIRHALPQKPLVENNIPFQVLVIGGTVCKNARVVVKNGNATILSLKEEAQPSFSSKDALSSFLLPRLAPNTPALAVNFAYPLQPVLDENRVDGILIGGTKENTFQGLLNTRIGSYIQELYAERFHKTIPVAVANDAICLLFSGVTQFEETHLAAGIVGTGTNFSFFLSDFLAINLESGNFLSFPKSDAAKAIDAQSVSPGTALFEKETAGAYLYQHFNHLLQNGSLPFPALSSTQELTQLASDSANPAASHAQALLKRSAALIACQIAGVTLFRKRDMTFIMEGSFFWGSPLYRHFVTVYTKQLAPKYRINFVRIVKSSTLGAASLATYTPFGNSFRDL